MTAENDTRPYKRFVYKVGSGGEVIKAEPFYGDDDFVRAERELVEKILQRGLKPETPKVDWAGN